MKSKHLCLLHTHLQAPRTGSKLFFLPFLEPAFLKGESQSLLRVALSAGNGAQQVCLLELLLLQVLTDNREKAKRN